MKGIVKKCLLIAFLLISLPLVSASYISGQVSLRENGLANFDIETDIPINLSGLTFQENRLTGNTEDLLSYRSGTWTFDIDLESYDDIFINIQLPSNLESLESITGNQHVINIHDKTITILDSGKLDFQLSYTLRETRDLSFIGYLALFLLLALVYFIVRIIRRKKRKFREIMPFVNDYEEKILESLMKRPVRQKELRKQLEIPKASFSRYISNLEKKRLITWEGEGKNKMLRLK